MGILHTVFCFDKLIGNSIGLFRQSKTYTFAIKLYESNGFSIEILHTVFLFRQTHRNNIGPFRQSKTYIFAIKLYESNGFWLKYKFLL